jgi:hypothetical protein
VRRGHPHGSPPARSGHDDPGALELEPEPDLLEAGNEKALATLIGYSHAQGLARRAFAPAELFAPETLEDTIV